MQFSAKTRNAVYPARLSRNAPLGQNRYAGILSRLKQAEAGTQCTFSSVLLAQLWGSRISLSLSHGDNFEWISFGLGVSLGIHIESSRQRGTACLSALSPAFVASGSYVVSIYFLIASTLQRLAPITGQNILGKNQRNIECRFA